MTDRQAHITYIQAQTEAFAYLSIHYSSGWCDNICIAIHGNQIQPILLIHAVIRDAISRLWTIFTRQMIIVPVNDFQHHTGRYRSQQYRVYRPTDRSLQGSIRREFLISGQHHTH